MRPIHAALVLFFLVVAIGGAYLLIRGDETSAEVATAAPPSALGPSRPDEPVALDAPADLDDEPARTAGAVAPPRAAAPAGAAKAASAAGASTLAGRVVDPFGNPVVGATVYAAPPSPWNDGLPLDRLELRPWMKRSETTTDDAGRFTVAVEDVARTRLAVRAPRFVPYDDEVAVAVGDRRDLGDLALEESVVLQGRVVDSVGRGVAGAELRRLQEDGGLRFAFGDAGDAGGVALTTTDDQGRFEVDQLAAGPWRIGVSHEAHPDAVVTGETERPGQVVSGLEFALADGFEIHGRVVGGPVDSAPDGSFDWLDEVTVVATPDVDLGALDDLEPVTRRRAPLAEDGTFVVRGLREGQRYRLQGRERDERRGALFGRSLTEAVTAEAGARGVELAHRPETALVFQVVDGATGEPLTRFDVAAGLRFPMPLRGEDGRTLHEHPEGRVRFTDLRPTAGNDRVTLQVEAIGYAPYERTDVVVAGGVDTDLGVIELERAPTVTVRVVDDATGAPVERARVRLQEVETAPSGSFSVRSEISIETDDDAGAGDLPLVLGGAHSVRTDADGVAVLTSLPGAEVRVVVRAKDYAPYKSEPVVLPVDEDHEVDVRLGLGGSVLVRVVDPDGAPAAGELVAHEGPGGPELSFAFAGAPRRTDADGELLFENLEPGRHTFRPGAAESGAVSIRSGGASFSMVRSVQRSGAAPAEPDAVEVEVVAGGHEAITLVAKRRSGLFGRVTEAGLSLAGATVSLVEAGAEASAVPELGMFGGGGPETKTNGSGEYELDEVEVGDYLLRVTHPSRAMPYEVEVAVVDGGSELDVELPATVLRGLVTGTDGKPLAGVRVRPERLQGGERRVVRQVMIMMTDGGDEESQVITGDGSFEPVLTDADGAYELRGVQPDVDLVVRAEGDGVQPGSSDPVRLLPGEVRTGVDVELLPGGTLPVEVLRADGSGASMCLITAEFEDEEGLEPKTGVTNKRGTTTLDGLRPGRWKLSARAMGFGGGGSDGANPETVVEVVAGDNEPAQLQLP